MLRSFVSYVVSVSVNILNYARGDNRKLLGIWNRRKRYFLYDFLRRLSSTFSLSFRKCEHMYTFVYFNGSIFINYIIFFIFLCAFFYLVATSSSTQTRRTAAEVGLLQTWQFFSSTLLHESTFYKHTAREFIFPL